MADATLNFNPTGGANLHSGTPRTGEVNWTRGGAQRWGINSGGLLSPSSGSPPPPTGAVVRTGDQILVFSGAGRLNTVFPHHAISGVAIHIYDAAVVARSGPLTHVESGYPVIGVVPANTWHPGGGTLLGLHPPIQFDTPFHSGLCVSCTSGTPGFTLTFTPEVVR